MGRKNPGVTYLLEDVAPSFKKAVAHLGAGPEQVIVAIVYLVFCTAQAEVIKNLRVKFCFGHDPHTLLFNLIPYCCALAPCQ